MKSIVITGSTRGIGRGLAENFLKSGCAVTINGRTEEACESAAAELQKAYGTGRVTFSAGDVTDPEDLVRLWETAAGTFGQVDIWINNAGVGHPMKSIWELPVETIHRVVDVDLKGTILGCRMVIPRMMEQGFGHIYNMEGFGSNGRVRPGLGVYGTTKAAVRYLTKALNAEVAKEARGAKRNDAGVKVGAISPGMVITDFLFSQFEDDPEGWEEAKGAFNMLGDTVETVTPWLVRKMLGNTKSGRLFDWLNPGKIIFRVLTATLRKRHVVDEVLASKS